MDRALGSKDEAPMIEQVPHTAAPVFKPVLLAVIPNLLSISADTVTRFVDLPWWNQLQVALGVAVSLYALYDYHLKVRWKRKQNKDIRKEQKHVKTQTNGNK